ncbi:MAG TPA: hypothetical protein VGH80_07325 [Xanthomonadaceae bacterium]|jgi:hypothetical protein
MAQPLREWKVLPHGALTELEDNLLTVVGKMEMPLVHFQRRMTVVRLRDRRLIVFNAIALDEDAMGQLEEYGKPAFLIVPNDHHRLDAAVWKQRYPETVVVTPEGSRERVEEVVHVDSVDPDFDDAMARFESVPGTGHREAALTATTGNGATLILNDLVGNLRNERGVGGWMLRMMGFASDEPRVPNPPKLTLISNRDALRDQFLTWSRMPSLRRILVSHGEPIEDDPPAVLRNLAASLQ